MMDKSLNLMGDRGLDNIISEGSAVGERQDLDWAGIAGGLLDVAHLTPEDDVNEEMVAALKRHFQPLADKCYHCRVSLTAATKCPCGAKGSSCIECCESILARKIIAASPAKPVDYLAELERLAKEADEAGKKFRASGSTDDSRASLPKYEKFYDACSPEVISRLIERVRVAENKLKELGVNE